MSDKTQSLRDEPAPRLWDRLKPWLPYLATLALFVAGLWSLYHLLREVSLREVRAQAETVPPSHLIGAVLATAAGYAALVCYDWSALRYIGRRLPARTIALGGFLGYAVGNTVGLSALSGGAVRYRVYSALGLGLADIARISAFVAVASGVGATMIGLAALVFYPDALGALLPLPAPMVQILCAGAFIVANVLIWTASLGKGCLRIGRFSLPAPRPPVLWVQMLVTVVDMCMGALVLYLLLPPHAGITFVPFLAVYLAAMMAGILSHVPGGVGVFETVVIAALPGTVSVTDAAAALLLYRLIYYIIPFVAALIILAGAEGRRLLTGRITGVALSLTTGLVPLAMGAMVMASGAVMMLAPMIPATSPLADEAEAAMPFALIETGALLSSALGAMLVLIAQGLFRRLAGAWWLTMIALAMGTGAALLDGWDTDRAALLALAFLLLLPCRGEFYRSTRLTTGALSPSWLLLVGAMLSSVVAVLFLSLNAARPYASDLWWQFADDERAPRALRAAMTGGIVLSLLSIWQALRRAPLRTAPAGPDEQLQVAAILARWGEPGARLALTGGKSYVFSEGGDAFVMYAVQGKSWVVLGDPIGDPTQIPGLIWAFRDAARRARATPVFYEASARWFPQWIETGMAVYKLGEEAVVDLAGFSLDGPSRKRLRTNYARAGRDGLRFELRGPGASDAVLGQLCAISDAWLASKAGREKAFSVGRFDPDWLRQSPLALVWQGEGDAARLVGFASVLLDGHGEAAAVDLMRALPDAPSGLMEYLFTALMLALKGQGLARLSLGMAPLSGLEDARSLPGRLGGLVYRHGGRFYGFAGLRQFKEKFDPDWQPRYLVLPRLANVVTVAADVTRLISAPLRAKEGGQGAAV